mgnify:CR=1 FL=1
MYGAPMSGEFFGACDRIDPEITALHRRTAIQCVSTILNDPAAADVFILALDGLLADNPTPELLIQRVKLLSRRIAQHLNVNNTVGN